MSLSKPKFTSALGAITTNTTQIRAPSDEHCPFALHRRPCRGRRGDRQRRFLPGRTELGGAREDAVIGSLRWIIGDTESGTGEAKRIHILVKPTRPDLQTNLVINTDRRTYLLELRSTEKTYMASVSWQYPQDQLIALRRQNAAALAAQPVAAGVDISALNFRYEIEGDTPAWRPLRAFDDGSKVYIEFPSGIRQGEMPPLFIIGPGGDSELVNYRARQNYYVVDRLFAAAELRLGDKNSERRVRIVRTDGRQRL
jgi:type IV secretion system protein VirB9